MKPFDRLLRVTPDALVALGRRRLRQNADGILSVTINKSARVSCDPIVVKSTGALARVCSAGVAI